MPLNVNRFTVELDTEALWQAETKSCSRGNNCGNRGRNRVLFNWVGGCPAAAEVVAETLVNGFVVPDHSSTAWNSGPTATIKTPVFTGSSSFTATAHVPVQVSVGGIYCSATVNVTNVPNWAGA